ncbi:MAG: YggS family pyridoxal phosphate-dependent enzyme [Candidatus Competibacterales bacterium]
MTTPPTPTQSPVPTPVAARYTAVCRRLRDAEERFGRPLGSVALVAVGKTKPPEAIAALAAAGQRRFGENYLQEALDKQRALAHFATDLEWHFIGPIQSNKTKGIAEHFAWVHSVDRLKIAQRLCDQRPPDSPPLAVCLQVNISGEASKSGVALGDLPELAFAVARLPRLALRGLMAVPAPGPDFAAQRQPFAALREALTALNRQGLELNTLSMGMSDDLEAAVAEGSTLVRIGSALFGPR